MTMFESLTAGSYFTSEGTIYHKVDNTHVEMISEIDLSAMGEPVVALDIPVESIYLEKSDLKVAMDELTRTLNLTPRDPKKTQKPTPQEQRVPLGRISGVIDKELEILENAE